jgi:hypothetical protein
MAVDMLAKLFGVVFVLIGVLGFVPGITSDGILLGILEVDALHNSIHLLTGVVALIASMHGMSRIFFKVFGAVYALVAVLGFMMGGSILDLIHTNMADNLLHAVIAVVALYAGFGM